MLTTPYRDGQMRQRAEQIPTKWIKHRKNIHMMATMMDLTVEVKEILVKYLLPRIESPPDACIRNTQAVETPKLL